MKYEEDWLMRQIKIIVNVVGKTVIKKTDQVEEPIKIHLTDHSIRLNQMLVKGDINQAENYLFDNIDRHNYKYLELGLDFYDRINKLDNDVLDRLDFSRDEIELGLKEFVGIYGFDYLNLDFKEV